jgi:glycerol uptake facilitator-like aquaporin
MGRRANAARRSRCRCWYAQVLVYMTAKVSGGKLNPAVSLGLLVSGSISA